MLLKYFASAVVTSLRNLICKKKKQKKNVQIRVKLRVQKQDVFNILYINI